MYTGIWDVCIYKRICLYIYGNLKDTYQTVPLAYL